jgi:hypothetical protein
VSQHQAHGLHSNLCVTEVAVVSRHRARGQRHHERPLARVVHPLQRRPEVAACVYHINTCMRQHGWPLHMLAYQTPRYSRLEPAGRSTRWPREKISVRAVRKASYCTYSILDH